MPREITEENRLDADPQLEWEADHSGVIHLRKTQSKTQFLEGYGTEDFGISPFETKKLISRTGVVMTSGIAAAGILGMRYKEKIFTGVQVLSTFALLIRESLRK